MDAESLYGVLGAAPNASAAELRAAFRKGALAAHPDKQGGSKEAFQKVLAAFEELINPLSRARYDRAGPGPGPSCRAAAGSKDTAEEEKKRKRAQRPAGCKPTEGERRGARARGGTGEDKCDGGQYMEHGDDTHDARHAGVKRRKHHHQQPCLDAQGEDNQGHGHQRPSSGSRAPEASPQAEAAAAPRGQGAKRKSNILQRLWKCLVALDAPLRRRLLAKSLPQDVRLALEAWMLQSHQHQAPSSTAARDQEDAEKEDQLDLLGEEEDDEDDSHSEDDDEGSLPLALCQPEEVEHYDENDAEIAIDDGCCFVVRPLAAPSEDGQKALAPRGRVHVRGVSSGLKHGKVYYWASVSFSIIRATSHWTLDLASALDNLALMTAARQRVQAFTDGSFEYRLRIAFADVGKELVDAAGQQGAPASLGMCQAELLAVVDERLGLSFRLTMSRAFWTGKGILLYTPGVHRIDDILDAWRKFASLPCSRIVGSLGWVAGSSEQRNGKAFTAKDGAHPPNLLTRQSPCILEEDWRSFCDFFVAQWSAGGKQPAEQVRARLQSLEAKSADHRERMMERWNMCAMLKEERRQLLAASAARRREAREHRAMRLEDSRSKGARRRCEYRQRSAEQCVLRLVHAWRQRRRIEEARSREEALRGQAREEQARAKAVAAERRARWRRMNHPGITMADLMAGCWD